MCALDRGSTGCYAGTGSGRGNCDTGVRQIRRKVEGPEGSRRSSLDCRKRELGYSGSMKDIDDSDQGWIGTSGPAFLIGLVGSESEILGQADYTIGRAMIYGPLDMMRVSIWRWDYSADSLRNASRLNETAVLWHLPGFRACQKRIRSSSERDAWKGSSPE